MKNLKCATKGNAGRTCGLAMTRTKNASQKGGNVTETLIVTMALTSIQKFATRLLMPPTILLILVELVDLNAKEII
jgi:hypothetical protein